MKKTRITLTRIAAFTLVLCLLACTAPLTAFADETRYTVSYETFGIGEPIEPTLSGRSNYDFDKIGNALNAVPVTTDERYAANGHWYLDRELTQRAYYTTVLTGDTTLYYKWVGPKEVIETVSLDIAPTEGSILWDYEAAHHSIVPTGEQSELYYVEFADWYGLNYEDTFIPGHTYRCDAHIRMRDDDQYEPLAFFKGHKSWDAEKVSVELPDSCTNAYIHHSFADSLEVSFTFTMPTTPLITTKELNKGYLDLDYHAQLAATNPDGGAVKWSADGLPNGLTVTEDGAVSGIPTQSGTFTVEVRAENSHGISTALLPLTVSETYGILVRSASGTDHPLQVRMTDTLAMISRRLLDEELIPSDREVFLTNTDGKLLLPERTLADYGIFNGGLININYSVTTYPVNVISGSADVSEAAYGQLVELTPAAAPNGSYFHGWEVVNGDSVVITGNCFEMPDGQVTVRAVYRSKETAYAVLTSESEEAQFGLAHTFSGTLQDKNGNLITDGPDELTLTLCNDINDPDAAEYTIQVENGAFELTVPAVNKYYQLIMITFGETERYTDTLQISKFNVFSVFVWLNSDNMKKEYLVGEDLDVSDGMIYIIRSGSEEVTKLPLTADMVSGFDSSKTGRQHLSVRNDYNDEILEYYVDVKKGYNEYSVFFETFGICDPPAPMKSVYSNWKYTTVIPFSALAYYPEYSNERYRFLGWTLNPDGTGEPLFDDIEMTGDVTLYAIWSDQQEIIDNIKFDIKHPVNGDRVPDAYFIDEYGSEEAPTATLEDIGVSLTAPWQDKIEIAYAEWSSIDWDNLDWDSVDWDNGGLDALARPTFDTGETYYLDLYLTVPEESQCVFKGYLDIDYIEDENGYWHLDTSNAPTVWFGAENVTAGIVDYHETYMHIRYSYTVRETPPVILGDTNGDGSIDVLDAVLIQKYSVDKIKFTDEQKYAADVNGDNNTDVLDATLIQKYAVGKITEFPKKA